MNKLDFIKTGVSIIVSAGTGSIVGNFIKHTTPINTKFITRFCINAGSFVLTSIAGDFAARYTEKKIDEGINMFDSHFHPKNF